MLIGASVFDNHMSTIGFCVFLGDALISWKSKKQPTVSKSSVETEYKSLSSIASELVWLNSLSPL